jgi:DNA-directed RNA polymerase specialized sigma24 family protein
MTTEELAMEVYIKILRSVQTKGLNKTYIRQAVMFVCIDEYRRQRDHDGADKFNQDDEHMRAPHSSNGQGYVTADETYGLTERLLALKIFEPRERDVILLLIEGKRNPEVRIELGIPKMSYYTLLNRIKRKYIGYLELYGDQEIECQEQAVRDLM